ncbi:MAG: cysteine desulfurase [Chitinophagales bacterium]
MFDVQAIRRDFPILNETVNGHPLVYFDNAATSQKPVQVIQAIANYYQHTNANIHRGAHHLAHQATEAYEASRSKIAQHIGSGSHEINFVRGTTEAVNLVAYGYGRKFIHEGDEVVVSEMEHHSNFVPWQLLCEERKATLKIIPFTPEGTLRMDIFHQMLSPKTKLVSVAYVSNALGTIHPVQEIIAAAHGVGAVVFIDGAQALPHQQVDVSTLDCDFLGFSAHKMLGPTGIGVLYGKEALLKEMLPFMSGGEMIKTVSVSGTTFQDLPYKFEAGTPHIAGAIGLGAAVDYLRHIGLNHIAHYENQLLLYATEEMKKVERVQLVGTAANKCSVISFNVDGIHAYDLGILLDKQGIAIRTGSHCCQPLMDRLGIEGTCRASFAFYNTAQEIDRFITALEKAIRMLA